MNEIEYEKVKERYKSEFRKLYEDEFAPHEQKFELIRKKYLLLTILCSIFAIIAGFAMNYLFIALGMFGASTMISDGDSETKIVGCLMLIFTSIFPLGTCYLLVYLIQGHFSKKLSKILKNKFQDKFTKIFNNIKWAKNDKTIITDEEIRRTNGFAEFNQRTIDDCFIGNHNGVEYKIVETEFSYVKSSGRSAYAHQSFQGVLVKFPCNKHVNSPTGIYQKAGFEESMSAFNIFLIIIGVIIIAVAKICLEHKAALDWVLGMVIQLFPYLLMAIIPIAIAFGKKVKTEDINFEKDYVTKSHDQVEARYLVTPAFIERFKNFPVTFKTKNVKCLFYKDLEGKDSIMFAIGTKKNIFEFADIYHHVNIEKCFEQILSIILMIDYFKLDEKTGL